ncbi:epoxide hydrolase [Mycena maculata]|uniref:Epoxide hydrolase n=1 Tax=Mycena maculata TaxID=230809 RepID=A0AAD7IGT5_9AGAR|nr:epoxide hydrolase [Mycena maculata]
MSTISNWPGLPKGIQSRTQSINDLEMHILEAFPSIARTSKPPLVILLHGFPEMSYSWRKIMGPLSQAGYHVVAPDQRGYGRTKISGESIVKYEDDLTPFRMTNLVKDIVTLVYTLGYESVAAVVGHDFGSPVAAYCALIRPDLFKSVVLMSAPFTGPPKLSLGNARPSLDFKKVVEDFAALTPPRKHYWFYCSTPEANAHMTKPPGGLHAFLREYYHMKSADWKGNAPHPLSALDAGVMAELPHYYVMPLDATMPEAVHPFGPSAEEIQGNVWLTEEELNVYTAEYARTGFQGGLNSCYRIATSPAWSSDLELFSGKQIEVPAMFLAGTQDWGTYQLPGGVEAMRGRACKNMEDFVLIDGAGHWVQQEQSDKVVEHLLKFLGKHQ